MKIEKLYTLSQFVDWIIYHPHMDESDILQYIGNYNDFLKKPLTKEMFVNDIEKPKYFNESIFIDEFNKQVMTHKSPELLKYESKLKVWKEAESKIIFNEIIRTNNIFGTGKINGWTNIFIEKFAITLIDQYNNKNWIVNSSDIVKKSYTLYELSEITNGKLKLKNAEI